MIEVWTCQIPNGRIGARDPFKPEFLATTGNQRIRTERGNAFGKTQFAAR